MSILDVPEFFAELELLIGRDNALSIVREFGGIPLQIPKKSNTVGYRKIADVIGDSGADKMIYMYGGDRKRYRCAPAS